MADPSCGCAIQLGLRGETLRRYAREWIAGIEDVTPFVHEQREQLGGGAGQLVVRLGSGFSLLVIRQSRRGLASRVGLVGSRQKGIGWGGDG